MIIQFIAARILLCLYDNWVNFRGFIPRINCNFNQFCTLCMLICGIDGRVGFHRSKHPIFQGAPR